VSAKNERMPASILANTATSESSIVDAAIWLIALGAIGVTLWYSLGPEPPGHASDRDLHVVAYFVNTLALLLAVVWRPGREDRRPRDWSIPIAACIGGRWLDRDRAGGLRRSRRTSDGLGCGCGRVALALLTFTLLRRSWKAASSI
jgi:hypothetical protein